MSNRLSFSSRYLKTLLSGAVAALLLSSCASGPKVFVNQNPAADFSGYQTYNYTEMLGTDEEKGYRSILSNYLIAATDREMQARGYRQADEPDLLINFYVNTTEKVRSTTSPTVPGGYYGYRGRYYGAYGGYETQVTQYTEGTLNIDLVDRRLGELAWEGVTVGKITEEVRQNLRAAVNNAVREVFSYYPYAAAGFIPPQSTAAAGTP